MPKYRSSDYYNVLKEVNERTRDKEIDTLAVGRIDTLAVGRVVVASVSGLEKRTRNSKPKFRPETHPTKYLEEEIKEITKNLKSLLEDPYKFTPDKLRGILPSEKDIKKALLDKEKILVSRPNSVYGAVIKSLLKGSAFHGIGESMTEVVEKIESDGVIGGIGSSLEESLEEIKGTIYKSKKSRFTKKSLKRQAEITIEAITNIYK